jgi:hypothetical protein
MLNFSQRELPPLFLGSSAVSFPLPSGVMSSTRGTNYDGTSPMLSIWVPQSSPYSESLEQALNFSGDGDPGD